MIDFFFKRKSVILDCFTYDYNAYNYAKIDKGTNYLPEWWNKTPKEIGGVSDQSNLTIKSCHGLSDFYKKGVVIPSWLEFKINVSKSSESKFGCESSRKVHMSSHYKEQFEFFHQNDGLSVKVTSVWRFRTKEKIYFTWTQPTWNMRNSMFNMSILPGVVNFYDQSVTNINLFLRFNDGAQSIHIEPLTPLVILHPLTDKKIEIKNHLIDEKEFVNNNPETMIFQRNQSLNDLAQFRKKRNKLLSKIKKLNLN